MSTVAVIASYAPSLVRFRGHLITEMVRRGHTVFALAPKTSEQVSDQIRRLGAQFVVVPMSRTGTNPFEDFRYFRVLFRLLRSVDPDCILSYTIKPVIYASFAARLSRVGRAFSMMTGLGFAFDPDSDFRASIARALLRRALKSNERVFIQNKDDLKDLEDAGCLKSEQAVLISGSGIDLDRFAYRPYQGEAISFLLIARLLEAKGLREYVAAARSLKAKYSSVRFHLVGWHDDNPQGIPQSELDEWLDEGVLEYHGELDDVRSIIAQCAVYVLPSYREGLPRTVLEAMAVGRPVVTTDVPGCRELVEEGENGFLVPPRDSYSLTDRMEYFIKRPNRIRQMGAVSRKLAEDRFDVEDVTRVILQKMRL